MKVQKNLKQIYNPWWKWECYKFGLYNTHPPFGIEENQAYQMYADFLSNSELFEKYIQFVLKNWIFSCQNFLTNTSINRVAYIGQASMCYYSRIPRKYRSGFHLLDETQKQKANNLAKHYLDQYEKNI